MKTENRNDIYYHALSVLQKRWKLCPVLVTINNRVYLADIYGAKVTKIHVIIKNKVTQIKCHQRYAG